jgi:hypothetical protein
MGSEERLSTRDIASPGGGDDPRFEHEADPAERQAAADAEATEAARPAPEAATPVPTGEPTDAVDDRRDAIDEPRDTVEPPRETVDEPPVETRAGGAATDTTDTAPLLADGEDFRTRWEEIQVRFVDEPRGAVEDADALVATVMQRLAESFAQERDRLEAQWGRGEDISTEDLRVTLQRYRSFFQRLLAT